jgi:3-methyladenine DNA glycosylase/8-oxoguanine DNA glycosylase
MDPSELTVLRYSRSKAEYLINAAQTVCSGQLPLERLAQGSAQVADRTLRSLRGLGPWTTHYTLMRGLGLADCMPTGDSGLAAGLQHLHQLPQRPTVEQMTALMAPFAPHRSLATCHVWASLATQA